MVPREQYPGRSFFRGRVLFTGDHSRFICVCVSRSVVYLPYTSEMLTGWGELYRLRELSYKDVLPLGGICTCVQIWIPLKDIATAGWVVVDLDDLAL